MKIRDLIFSSEAARILGVSSETIRLWDKRGILKATRTEAGVRLFDRRDVERLQSLRKAAASGLNQATTAVKEREG